MELKNGTSIVQTRQAVNPESGILKATNNGLRQQSFARPAEIKVGCISNKNLVLSTELIM